MAWIRLPLRVNRGSKLVRCGASIEVVRVMAGGSTLAITQRYVHAASADLRTAIAKLPGNG
jgi:site-specific recombinase XerD